MDTMLYILLVIVWSIPTLAFMELRRRKQAAAIFIARHAGSSPIIYPNIAVWCKKLQPISRRNKWTSILPNNRSYDFYSCDIVLTKYGVIVCGRSTILGFGIAAIPVFFTNHPEVANPQDNIIRIAGYRKRYDDLEIDFNDPAYPEAMTLVIKNIGGERGDWTMQALNI